MKYHVKDDFTIGVCTAEKTKCRYLKNDEVNHFNKEAETFQYVKLNLSEQNSSNSLLKRENSGFLEREPSLTLISGGLSIVEISENSNGTFTLVEISRKVIAG